MKVLTSDSLRRSRQPAPRAGAPEPLAQAALTQPLQVFIVFFVPEENRGSSAEPAYLSAISKQAKSVKFK